MSVNMGDGIATLILLRDDSCDHVYGDDDPSLFLQQLVDHLFYLFKE